MTKEIVIRARKFMKNKLLDRRQFLIDVFTPDFSTVSKKDVADTVAKKFKVAAENVVIFGLKYKFGGGRATGFGLIYENKDSLIKFEPKHRLIRSKLIGKKESKGRRLKKEHKNKTKKLRGKAKMSALKTDKKKK